MSSPSCAFAFSPFVAVAVATIEKENFPVARAGITDGADETLVLPQLVLLLLLSKEEAKPKPPAATADAPPGADDETPNPLLLLEPVAAAPKEGDGALKLTGRDAATALDTDVE